MGKRKGLSASVRWEVFRRDNFTCQYCGGQAGQEGITLAVDHVRSVADDGDNRMDNLVTACHKCNGGKGARSLEGRQVLGASVAAAAERADRLRALAEAARSTDESNRQLQIIVESSKNRIWGFSEPGGKGVFFDTGEVSRAVQLCKEFGWEQVMMWYQAAHDRDVGMYRAIRYVCGCAKNARKARVAGGHDGR